MDSTPSDQTILLATTNEGKVAELRALLSGLPWRVISLSQLPTAGSEVAETGTTFAENARLKAQQYAERTGYRTVADDSGLEVAALNGEPGVSSARWLSGSDADRVTGLLQRLADHQDRRAQFTCVVCYYDPQRRETKFFTGTTTGRIDTQPHGSTGFGYDPIFIPDGFSTTFAQLGTAVKNTISHRAKAMRQLVQFLLERGAHE